MHAHTNTKEEGGSATAHGMAGVYREGEGRAFTCACEQQSRATKLARHHLYFAARRPKMAEGETVAIINASRIADVA